MLKAIAQFIATKTGFVLGAKLQFAVWGENTPERAVQVAFNAGGRVYFFQPGLADIQVQIRCRAPQNDYLGAYEDAMTAYNALHGTVSAGSALPVVESGQSYFAQAIEALALPQYLGPDDQGRHEWSTNYTFRLKKVTA